MALPHQLTHADILRVLDWIDLNPKEIPRNQRVRKFGLLRDQDKSKQYPPKFVVRKAYGLLIHGPDWARVFSGGTQANNFLIKKGFKVWDRDEQTFVGLEAAEEDVERIFREGRVLAQFRKHIRIERNGSLSGYVKKLRLKSDPQLHCDVCDFSFVEAYGEIGAEFIEAHHRSPLGGVPRERDTAASDIALVCSNCHRMLHGSNPLLKPEKLRELLKSHKKA
jgi:hypothetical protein